MHQPSQALRDALDASHQRVVSDLFDAIDRDGSGVLSKAEVDDFFSGPAGTKPWSLNALDANSDGQVTWAASGTSSSFVSPGLEGIWCLTL